MKILPKYVPTLEDLWKRNNCKCCGEDMLDLSNDYCSHTCESVMEDMYEDMYDTLSWYHNDIEDWI